MDILLFCTPIKKNPVEEEEVDTRIKINVYYMGGKYHSTIRVITFNELLEYAEDLYDCSNVRIMYQDKEIYYFPENLEEKEVLDITVIKNKREREYGQDYYEQMVGGVDMNFLGNYAGQMLNYF